MKAIALALAGALACGGALAHEKRESVTLPEKQLTVSLAFDSELLAGRSALRDAINAIPEDADYEERTAYFDDDGALIAVVEGYSNLKTKWSWGVSTTLIHDHGNLVYFITFQGNAYRLGHWRCVSRPGSAYRVCSSFDRPGVTMVERANGQFTWEPMAFSDTPGPAMKAFAKLAGGEGARK